jgi:hypothetical protein
MINRAQKPPAIRRGNDKKLFLLHEMENFFFFEEAVDSVFREEGFAAWRGVFDFLLGIGSDTD